LVFLQNKWTLALAGVMSVSAGPAYAESVTLEAAVRRTLELNPVLVAEGATVRALEQKARLDGLAPAPTLDADLENVLGTGSVSGVRGAEATLRLSQVFERGGKRAARVARGSADIAYQQNVIEQRRLDLAAETTRRYIAISSAEQELALAGQQTQLLRETEKAVRERVNRGVAPEADRTMAEIAVARAELEREHAEHELASARFGLVVLWGETAALPISTTAELLRLPEVADFKTLAARLDATPEAAAFTLESDRLSADSAIARAAAKPDYSLSFGVRRLEALDDQGLVMSFSMPFGSQVRSDYALARTQAEQQGLDARRRGAQLETSQKLFSRHLELGHARAEVEALTKQIIPAAERGLALTQRGYNDARYSILQLTQAQALLLQLKQQRLAAATRFHLYLADIERFTAGVTP
jgi:outer membrane protein, heavy metal efflux system